MCYARAGVTTPRTSSVLHRPSLTIQRPTMCYVYYVLVYEHTPHIVGAPLTYDVRGGSSFFPRGGFDPSSTSRVAASRFFLWLFYEPRSGEPIFFGTILRAAKRRADFFWLFDEPRSGEPIFFWLFYEHAKRRADFFGLFWTPVSDVFLASTNAMETMITSLAAQGGGGGGLNPIVWGWAWDRVL